jgi:rhodanese-related sulfurtransferase
MPSLNEIDAATLKGLLDQGRAVVVDVREPDEYIREHIAGAMLVPLSRFDASQVPPDNARTVVLHCKAGGRSAEAGARLLAAGRPGATHLRGGFDAWKAAGMPVERTAKAPIPIMRQVQIVAGSVVLIGSILAWRVSLWFLILPIFFGGGLVFAGVSGMCGMAAVLRLMPWNKAFTAAAVPGNSGKSSR